MSTDGPPSNKRAMLKSGSMRNSNDGGKKVLSAFELRGDMSAKVRATLKQFDVNDDEQLDVGEVTALVEHMLSEERQGRHLKFAVGFLSAFTVILLASMFGLTWAVVAALKDTKIENNLLVTSSGDTVRVANADYTLDDNGIFISRAYNASTNSTNAVRSAVFTGTKSAFTSLISPASLTELNYLDITGPDGAQMMLKVEGVARIPQWDSYWGSIVKIITPVGTLSLDNDELTFSDTIAPLFQDAGFTTAPTAKGMRKLMQGNSQGNGNGNGNGIGNGNGNGFGNGNGNGNNGINGLFNYINQASFNINPSTWNMNDVSDKSQAMSRGRTQGQAVADSATVLAANFAEWKRAFATSYDTQAQNSQALAAFTANMQLLAQVNNDPSKPYWLGGNRFLGKTVDQLNAEIIQNNTAPTLAPGDITATQGRRSLLQTAPASVDWRTSGRVNAVRNQGACGNCWAFAATSVVESNYMIATSRTGVDLSEAHFTYCCRKTYNVACASSNACGGGSSNQALNYARTYGLTTEANYAWTTGMANGVDYSCKWATGSTAATVVKPTAGYKLVTQKSATALRAQVAIGPVVNYFMVSGDFYWYAGGTYTGTGGCTASVNHAMVIVGYKNTGVQSSSYWIIRNSWDSSWGTGGYATVTMAPDGSTGVCGNYVYSFATSTTFTATGV